MQNYFSSNGKKKVIRSGTQLCHGGKKNLNTRSISFLGGPPPGTGDVGISFGFSPLLFLLLVNVLHQDVGQNGTDDEQGRQAEKHCVEESVGVLGHPQDDVLLKPVPPGSIIFSGEVIDAFGACWFTAIICHVCLQLPRVLLPEKRVKNTLFKHPNLQAKGSKK